MNEALTRIITHPSAISDRPVADVVEFVHADVVGVDVGGQAVDMGTVGDSSDFSVVVGWTITRGDVKLLIACATADFFQDINEPGADPDEIVGVVPRPEFGESEVFGELCVGESGDERGGRFKIDGLVLRTRFLFRINIRRPTTSKPQPCGQRVGGLLAARTGPIYPQLATRRAQVEFFALIVSGEDEVESLGKGFEESQFGNVDGEGVSPILGRADEPPADAGGLLSDPGFEILQVVFEFRDIFVERGFHWLFSVIRVFRPLKSLSALTIAG